MVIDFGTRYIPYYFNNLRALYNDRDNRPLIDSYRRLICNTCLVAQKIFAKFPPFIANAARLSLSYGGTVYVWINRQVILGNLKKTMVDCVSFYRIGSCFGVVHTAMKVYTTSIDTIMTVGGTVVSVAALLGYSQVIVPFYLFMRPFSLCSLFFSGFTFLINYHIDYKLYQDENNNTRGVYHRIWVDAQKYYQETLSLEDKAKISRNGVVQFIVNQGVFMICAAYPMTLLSTTLTWGTSLFDTALKHYEWNLKKNTNVAG